MSGIERVSPRGRSQIDNELARIIRAAMEERKMRQKDLAAATGLTEPQVSVRLSRSGSSIPVRHVVLFCAALDLDVSEVLTEATQRAEAFADSMQVERPGYGADPQEQVNAVARQLAASLWNGADSWDFINIAIEETLRRENEEFWTEKRKRWILEIALAELAYSIGRRNPIRDPFPLKPPRIDPEAITR